MSTCATIFTFFYYYLNIYTALQKFGNALENGVLDNIGTNPF